MCKIFETMQKLQEHLVLSLQMVSPEKLRPKEQVHGQLSQSSRLLTTPEACTPTVL